ncbi:MAG: ferrous iron transport protein A [Sumerlaeia bacterium]
MKSFDQPTKLSSLRGGQTAIVEEFQICSNDQCRLKELGFREGQLVKMLMPGCSCAVAVGNTRVMVRRELLDSIHVVTID